MYTYEAKLDRVVDGDTIDLFVDLGFHISHKIRVRLARVDTPPARTEEGKLATQYVIDAFDSCLGDCHVVTSKKGRWGRWIGEIYLTNGNLSDLLLENELAEVLD